MKNRAIFVIFVNFEHGSRYFFSRFENEEEVFSPHIKDAMLFDSLEEAEAAAANLSFYDGIFMLRGGVLKWVIQILGAEFSETTWAQKEFLKR